MATISATVARPSQARGKLVILSTARQSIILSAAKDCSDNMKLLNNNCRGLPQLRARDEKVRCGHSKNGGKDLSAPASGLGASLQLAAASAMTAASPALALVDERMSTEGTGLSLGLSNVDLVGRVRPRLVSLHRIHLHARRGRGLGPLAVKPSLVLSMAVSLCLACDLDQRL
jgi:hypothetical protein